MYGEKREYIEDMFCPDHEVEEEAKKNNKRHRKSESASTSPDIRQRENGVILRPIDSALTATKETLVDQMHDNKDVEDEMDKDMKETNPAFLKYLQFKVRMGYQICYQ